MKASEWNTYFLRNNDDNSLLFIVVVETLAVWACARLLMTFCNRIVAISRLCQGKAVSNNVSTFIRRGFCQSNDEQMFAASMSIENLQIFLMFLCN